MHFETDREREREREREMNNNRQTQRRSVWSKVKPKPETNISFERGREMVQSFSISEGLPFAAMVTVECLDVGLTTLSKAAMSKGMSHFVFVVYSNALASLLLLPISFFLERAKRPPLTLAVLCRFFFLGLLVITAMQNFVFTGISYSSPTLGSAMSNLIPAFTFLLAIIFRMERLDFRKSSSTAKFLGTLVSISGALIVTLYKGPTITHTSSPPHLSNDLKGDNWVLGAVFLACASLSIAIWNTLQAATVNEYPAEMTITTFTCVFGTIQSAIVALISEHDHPNVWRLKPDIELISIIYSAVIGSMFTFTTETWCIHKKGPLFVAMFKPLSIAIAAIMGAIFLGDSIHLGSVIGAIIIAIGFYSVMWGLGKEKNNEVQAVASLESTLERQTLLQKKMEI